MLQSDVIEPLLEELVDALVEGGDDLLRVLHQLSVQLGTELLDVQTRDVEIRLL